MSVKLSRRKIADYVAREITHGNRQSITLAAAYLVQHRRTREARLIVRDIELRLMSSGEVVTEVISARELSTALKSAIKTYIADQYNGSNVRLDTSIDSSLIGGIILRTPDAELDASIKTRLTNLTT